MFLPLLDSSINPLITLQAWDERNLLDGEFAEYYEENDITEYEMYQLYKDGLSAELNFSVMKGNFCFNIEI